MPPPPSPILRSPQNPRVKALLRLRKPRERRAAGVLLAEGRREVSRAAAAGLALRELWVRVDGGEPAGAGSGDDFGPLPAVDGPDPGAVLGIGPGWARELPARGVAVHYAAPRVFAQLAYHQKPEGVLAVFSTPRWTLEDLDPVRLQRESPGGVPPLYLVAVGTEKPGNLGAMARTAAAAGCAGLVAAGPAVDVFNPNALRNSTGALFSLPTVVAEESAVREWLHQRGVRCAAALADAGRDCFAVDWAGPEPGSGRWDPWALVVGPEHAGLSGAWREAAAVGLTIPAAAESRGVDSLNAANAAAVLLFDAVRRRRAARPG